MYRVELPWPDSSLSPNSRPHWAKKAKATKTAKGVAAVLTRVEVVTRPKWPRVFLEWTFHPKTANAVDKDNCIASCKAYHDGIAIALGIDDSLFETTYHIGQVVKGGKVVVTIKPIEITAWGDLPGNGE